MRSFDFAIGTELLLFLWHLVEIVLKLSTLHITRKTEAGFLYAVFTLLLTLQKTPRTVIFFCTIQLQVGQLFDYFLLIFILSKAAA